MFVPVVDYNNNPLMPTSPARARRWVTAKKATPFWKNGIWCVRLNIDPSARNLQKIAVGIDPGFKQEGITVKSELHTYLNIQLHAVDWVKEKLSTRRDLRKGRRYRKTPYRKPRYKNRLGKNLCPSIKSRWQLKLRVLNNLKKIFPITYVVVEDIKVRRNIKIKWNKGFSAVQCGKRWFFEQVQQNNFSLKIYYGFTTKKLRTELDLPKNKKKLHKNFYSHCVDSWVLANKIVGGHTYPDNTDFLIVKPIKKHYRNLHVQNPIKGGIRKCYGSTRSLGFERGSIVKHPKYGVCLIGGCSKVKNRVSLHCPMTGRRLTQKAKIEDITFKSFNSFLVK